MFLRVRQWATHKATRNRVRRVGYKIVVRWRNLCKAEAFGTWRREVFGGAGSLRHSHQTSLCGWGKRVEIQQEKHGKRVISYNCHCRKQGKGVPARRRRKAKRRCFAGPCAQPCSAKSLSSRFPTSVWVNVFLCICWWACFLACKRIHRSTSIHVHFPCLCEQIVLVKSPASLHTRTLSRTRVATFHPLQKGTNLGLFSDGE